MRISARADYAVRAVLELAVRQGGGPVKAGAIAAEWDIPRKFPEGIPGDLGRAGVVADLVADALPEPVRRPAAQPAAWQNP
ncbi:Rrf2 family transcriptional regulator [Streptomyces anandii]|uniref:Rrf2 family transcriptional regulator n=1 Tax=Streptomyces anandii TaxID=285454 RepID=A0ABW6H148_9ACTN